MKQLSTVLVCVFFLFSSPTSNIAFAQERMLPIGELKELLEQDLKDTTQFLKYLQNFPPSPPKQKGKQQQAQQTLSAAQMIVLLEEQQRQLSQLIELLKGYPSDSRLTLLRPARWTQQHREHEPPVWGDYLLPLWRNNRD